MNAHLSRPLILKCMAHSLSPGHSIPLSIPAGFFPVISKGEKQSLVCQFREDSMIHENGGSLRVSKGPI